MSEAKIEFRALAERDLPLMTQWLNKDHMRRFYQKAPISLEAVIKKYMPRINGEVPTFCHIAFLDGIPFGALQTYRIKNYPEFGNEIGINAGLSIDLFIGESAYLGRGLGKSMLRQYMDLAFQKFSEENLCYICHEAENIAALQCSKAVGFQFVREVIESGAKSALLVFDKPLIVKEELPWNRGILVNTELATSLLRANFRDFSFRRIEFLKAGWDSCAFLVDDAFVFRFPKRAEVEDRLRGEIELLKIISNNKNDTIPIPQFEFLGSGNANYPFLFVGYRKLRGESQAEKRVLLQNSELMRLVQFLKGLHSIPIDSVSSVKEEDSLPSNVWQEGKAKFEERLLSLSRVNALLEKQVRDFLENYRWSILDKSFTKCFVHNDLLPEHILLNAKGDISGIIDWGDAAIDDPAIDYAGLGYCFGFEDLITSVQHSGFEDKERVLKRAILGWVFAALSDVWYGEKQNEKIRIEFAVQSLEGLFSGNRDLW